MQELEPHAGGGENMDKLEKIAKNNKSANTIFGLIIKANHNEIFKRELWENLLPKSIQNLSAEEIRDILFLLLKKLKKYKREASENNLSLSTLEDLLCELEEENNTLGITTEEELDNYKAFAKQITSKVRESYGGNTKNWTLCEFFEKK